MRANIHMGRGTVFAGVGKLMSDMRRAAEGGGSIMYFLSLVLCSILLCSTTITFVVVFLYSCTSALLYLWSLVLAEVGSAFFVFVLLGWCGPQISRIAT